MEFNFQGKRALVTGAGKGIGRGIAVALMKCGADTYGISRTQEDLDSLEKEVPGIHTIKLDITDWDDTRKVVEEIGQIDMLVNNAGISITKMFLETEKDDLTKTFDTNYHAAFNISQVVCRELVKRGKPGSVVHVSSVSSKVASERHTTYGSSKAALDYLTKSMAHELGKHQVVCRDLVNRGKPGSVVNVSSGSSIKAANRLCTYSASKAALDGLTRSMAQELGKRQIRVNSVNPTVCMTDMGRKSWSDPVFAKPVLDRISIGRFVEVDEIVKSVLFLLSDNSSAISGQQLFIDGGGRSIN